MYEHNEGDISLLYPDINKYRAVGAEILSGADADCLELYELLDVGGGAEHYLSCDAEIIRYRQKTMRDMAENPQLDRVLTRMLPYLSDITELRRMTEDADFAGDSYLLSITEAEIFNSLAEFLREELLPLSDSVSSPAFTALCERVRALTESEYFRTLSVKLGELSQRVRDIKSVTIGVNLDGRLQPESAGVLSVNGTAFKGGDFFERVMRLDFKNDDMTCIAELIPFSKNQPENRRLALTNAFNSAVSAVFKSSLRDWKRACGAYVLENTDFLLRLAPEIEFVCAASRLITRLRERGCPLCVPTVCEMSRKSFDAKGLCNPVIALKTEAELVPNDFSFDENGMIYVLTGPNRGGKSVLTCAVGHAFVMAQMGLPVCAGDAVISPADRIFTHFPGGSEDTVEKGRLGEECSRLGAIFDGLSEYSLVLLDEALSSTGAYEGSLIASEILAGFSIAHCRGIFSTHLHELAAGTDNINERCRPLGGVAVDNLCADISEGKRSFRIERRAPDGKSYAADIASKYGLSFDEINTRIGKNRGQKR